MDLRETGRESELDSSDSAYGPVAGSNKEGGKPSGSIKFWKYTLGEAGKLMGFLSFMKVVSSYGIILVRNGMVYQPSAEYIISNITRTSVFIIFEFC
jgi:hypothetical protein